MGMIDRLRSWFAVPGPEERAIAWPGMVTIGGHAYPLWGLNQTLPGGKQIEIETTYEGLAYGAYLQNPVVYACVEARKALFSEARFMFRQRRSGTPGELFSNPELDLLTTPWPGGTTGDLLAQMSQHEDLGGNAFVIRLDATTLFQPRPDWVTIVLGADKRSSRALPIGLVYHPGGRTSGVEVETFLWDQVAHFMPTPDPLAPFRGVSWLRTLAREVSADIAATDHKLRFFEAGATPNLIVSVEKDLASQAWKDWIDKFRENYEGVANAYKTMLLGAGATAQVVGKDLQQLEFRATQGAGETRIAASAGVPPVVVGLSEGLQGSSLNAGNFAASMRRFADITMRPRWRNAAGSLARLVRVPSAAELWYDASDITALKDDIKDAAEVMFAHAQANRQLVDAGWEPDTVVDYIKTGDVKRLKHTGLYSVQLQPPQPEGPPPVTVTAPTPPLLPAKAGRDEGLAAVVAVSERWADAVGRRVEPAITVNVPEQPVTVTIERGAVEVPVTVNTPEVHVAPAEVRNEITVEPTPVTIENTVEPTPVEIRNEVTVEPAPVHNEVNVSTTPVEVNVEPTPVSITNEIPTQRPVTRRIVREAGQITSIIEEPTDGE